MIGHSTVDRPEVFLQVEARNVLGDIQHVLPQLAGSFSILSHFFQEPYVNKSSLAVLQRSRPTIEISYSIALTNINSVR